MTEQDRKKAKALVALAAGVNAQTAMLTGQEYADKVDQAGLLDDLGIEDYLP